MGTRTFTLSSGDRNVGEAYLPDGASARMPVIIHCHGWNMSGALRPCTQALLARCLPARMALVSFDFFGCGRTGGNVTDMTFRRWVANLDQVVDWVARQEWADPSRMGCFAISAGTAAALRLAAATSKLRFIISVATCLGLLIDMPVGPGRALADNWDALLGGGKAAVFGTPLPLEFFRDFVGRAPAYDLSRVSCPVFFLQGKKDDPWRRADAWLGSLVREREGLPVKYRELENGGHGLDEVADQCADEIMTWLGEIGILKVDPR